MNHKRLRQRPGQPVKFTGKTIGYIVDDVFEARRRGSKHIYRKVPGWAFSVDVLEYLDDEGIQEIRIMDLETQSEYSASLHDFQTMGVFINFSGDPQLCLPLDKWQSTSRIYEKPLSGM